MKEFHERVLDLWIKWTDSREALNRPPWAVSRLCTALRTPSDSVGLRRTPSDSVGLRRTPSDSVGLRRTPSDSVGLRRTPSDSVGLRRTPSDSVGLRRTPSDSGLFPLFPKAYPSDWTRNRFGLRDNGTGFRITSRRDCRLSEQPWAGRCRTSLGLSFKSDTSCLPRLLPALHLL